jgi:hypothetical protein
MTTQAMAAEPTGTAVAPAATPVPLRVAAVASVLAGLIHYAVVPEHRGEWWLYAAFFTMLGAFEIVWAAAVWTSRQRWLLLLGVVVNIAVLAVWTYTRTAGLPFGPDAGEAEPIGTLDIACCLFEAVTAGAALLGLRRRKPVTGR